MGAEGGGAGGGSWGGPHPDNPADEPEIGQNHLDDSRQAINGCSLPVPAPKSRPLALRLRQAHATLAPLVVLPLLITVVTGLGYRLLRDWGGVDRDRAHLLMVLHEGEWLTHWFGRDGETVYVLLNGLGLLWMLATGVTLLVQRWRRGVG
jgi:hypothetical protein